MAFSEEDEKTTIESGWEEEGSTTVEQGEVAERMRTLGVDPPRGRGTTNITSTSGHSIDEPTVDDQRANAAIAMIAPPVSGAARLLVTQGNDSGHQLEITPGKTYTIGRAIENDLVLTDIAVSRKHFDLRAEAGAWVLVDRGSGNGTLVNGNLEDQPFTLASGDLIEIGNTVFRFEQPNAPPRPARPARPVAGTHKFEHDEEEPSTVAGKPMATPAQVAPPPRPPRAKTAPPPAPPARPRASTAQPVAYAAGSQGPSIGGAGALAPGLPRPLPPKPPPPAPGPITAPPPSLTAPPLTAASLTAPPLTAAPLTAPPLTAQPPSIAAPQQPRGGAPGSLPPLVQSSQALPATTLPMPQMSARPSVPSLVPSLAPARPQAPAGPAILGADASGLVKGPVGNTLPGGPPPPKPHALPFTYPSIADMHKHAMLVASTGPARDATSTALVQPTPFGGQPSALSQVYTAPALSRRTKLLLAGAGLTLLAAIATIAIMKGSEPDAGAAEPAAAADGAAIDAAIDALGVSAPAAPAAPAARAQKTITPIEPADAAAATSPKAEPAGGEPTRTDAKAKAAPAPASGEPAPGASAPAPAPGAATPPDARTDAKVEAAPARTAEPAAAAPQPPPARVARPEPVRAPKREKDPPKRTAMKREKDPPKREAPARRTQVAAADASAARSRALELYRRKRFGDAAAVLQAAAAATSGAEATELRSQAGVYNRLGAAYNRGMSPGARAIDAYKDLRSALSLDSGNAAGELTVEIKQRLAQVAPKAAIALTGAKDYEAAFQAVRTAEGFGVSNGDTQVVRSKLEQVARELYQTAAKELDDNPEAAKQKLRRIRGMVDAKSPTLAKANALLSGK